MLPIDFQNGMITYAVGVNEKRDTQHAANEYRMYKPPATIKQLHTNTLNQAIFISESAAVTYPHTV